MNLENLKIIMFEKKTGSLSLRNQDWRTVKTETEKKMNELLTRIPTKNITGLIYVGAKFVRKKSRFL